MGKFSRDKGARVEREIVTSFRESGLPAKRTAPMQTFKENDMPDILVETKTGDKTVEVKARAKGKQFHEWLGTEDLLVYKVNGEQPLAIIPLTTWIELNGGTPT